MYAGHSDTSEMIGIYTDPECTTLLNASPASEFKTDNDGPNGGSNGTGAIELDVGSNSPVTVYVARESNTRTAYEVTLPANVLQQNNGKLFIHFNKSNVKDYRFIYVNFGVEKSVIGSKTNQATFEFTLKSLDGAPMPVDATGDTATVTVAYPTETTASFGEIEYAKPGEYKYELTEIDGKKPGYAYDTTKYTLIVTVVDDDGVLVPSATLDGENFELTSYEKYVKSDPTTFDKYKGTKEIKFTNTYTATGSVTFEGTKEMIGRALKPDDKFTFTVKENDTPVATGHNAGETIVFDEISYEVGDIGPHEYEITEDDTTIKGVSIDKTVAKVMVTVTDNGDGTLTAVPDYGTGNSGVKFTNKFDAAGKITFPGSKSLTGRALNDGEFTFTVTETTAGATAVYTGKNDASGNIVFDEIVYPTIDSIGTHTYEVTEDDTGLRGMTYDTSVLSVTVRVTMDDTEGVLNAEIVKAESDEIAFVNSYEAKGTITFEGTKTLNGRKLTDDDVFTFTVTEDGNTVATGKNDGNGKITFTEIKYVLNKETSDLGEHTYTVTEDATTLPGITGDDSKLTVKVKVSDNGDGTLKTEILTGSDDIEFTNEYAAEGSVDLTAAKYMEKTGQKPGAEDKFDFYLELENGSRITVQNVNETVDFGSIVYTLEDTGTHVYTLREKQLVNGLYITDPTVYEITVIVTDNGDGTLDCAKSVVRIDADGTKTDLKAGDEIAFVNEYKVSISLTKEWEGGEEDEITLILYADGKKVPESETVTDPETGEKVTKYNYDLSREGYRYTFSQLAPRNADGSKIVYGVKEKGVSGYMRIYSNVGEYKNKTDYIYDGGTVINRAVKSIRVKKVWDGIPEAKRPAITLTLYCNGSVYGKKPSGPNADGWYTWSNLPTVVNGRDAVYYVIEEPIEGIKTKYSNTGMQSDVTDRAYNGGTITNSGVPATGDTNKPVLWSLLTLLAMAGCVLLIRKGKKTVKR